MVHATQAVAGLPMLPKQAHAFFMTNAKVRRLDQRACRLSAMFEIGLAYAINRGFMV